MARDKRVPPATSYTLAGNGMATSSIALETQADAQVGMGKVVVGRAPADLKAILGSCVGVALYNRKLRLGSLAHVVLPESAERPGGPGKFADTAIPHMVDLMRRPGVRPFDLEAKIAGGANMFGSAGPLQVGDANVEAVLKALQTLNIRVIGRDTGGNVGRRVTFRCAAGEYVIETAGREARIL